MIVKHPDFADVTKSVPDEHAARWEAAGWLPLLNADQRARLAQIEGEVQAAAAAPCPTCGSSGDEPCVTSSGRTTTRHAARANSDLTL